MRKFSHFVTFAVRYVPSTWRSWLVLADVGPDITDRAFSAIGPATISRSQIRTLAKNADSADGRLTLLIAILIWGRGTANGRMREAIVRALKHSDRDHGWRPESGVNRRAEVPASVGDVTRWR